MSLLEDGEYVTGFEYLNEKHISLRMNTESGVEEIMTLNVVCKPKGINARISVEDGGDTQLLCMTMAFFRLQSLL